MKTFFFTITFVVAITLTGFAQIGMGTATPNPSSILDLTSTNKAFLPPRMNTAQRTAIASPVAGMLVYNTDSTCIETYSGTKWINLCNIATLFTCCSFKIYLAVSVCTLHALVCNTSF